MTTITTELTPTSPRLAARSAGSAQRLMRRFAGFTLLGLVLLGCLAAAKVVAQAGTLQEGWTNLRRFAVRVGPLTFPPLGELLSLTAMTLGIVVLGTLLAAILSVPVAWLAAANTTPNRWTRAVGRLIGVLARAVPDVVMAMVFVLMFSLGALPGILAFGLHSVGMISRLFADAIEQANPGPPRAIQAAGGSRFQVFVSGIVPQVFPSWVATTIHRADINLRGSVLLGYAGVAGLGLAMRNAFAVLNYSLGLGYAVAILLLCVGMELVSTAARYQLLGGARRRDKTLKPHLSPAQRSNRVAAKRSNRKWLIALVVLLLVAGSVVVCQIAWHDLISFWGYVPQVAAQFWPPNAGSYGLPRFAGAMATTVMIALAAVTLALPASLLLGSLAARNVAPNRTVRAISRLCLVIIRAIPELVLAIVLIIVTGLGAPAGTLALAVCGIGLLGKLVADSLEENPRGPETALRTVGASRLQVYTGATLPMVRRAVIGHAFYLLDTNIRSATILGIVGGGGIGYYLLTASQGSRYGQVTLIVGLIVTVVLVVEALAMWARRALR